MIGDVNMQSLSTAKARLSTEKALRADKRTVADEAQGRAATAAAEVKTCQAHEAELRQQRAEFIAAMKPVAAHSISERLNKAGVFTEVAESKYAECTRAHTVAAAALAQATEAVSAAARAVRVQERADLIARCEAALDHLISLGRSLEGFAGPLTERPPELSALLERLPKPDPLHTPVNELRGFVSQRRWDQRLAELMADDEAEQARAAAA